MVERKEISSLPVFQYSNTTKALLSKLQYVTKLLNLKIKNI